MSGIFSYNLYINSVAVFVFETFLRIPFIRAGGNLVVTVGLSSTSTATLCSDDSSSSGLRSKSHVGVAGSMLNEEVDLFCSCTQKVLTCASTLVCMASALRSLLKNRRSLYDKLAPVYPLAALDRILPGISQICCKDSANSLYNAYVTAQQ